VSTATALESLADILPELTPVPQHPALRHLVESLKQRHSDCVQSILFYGSCLRSGDPFDGLVDLYLIVDNYRCANSSWLKALLNQLLPPNVFYAEFPFQGKTIRCKYAILSTRDLQRGTSTRWFQAYLWGRFSQPTALAWWRNEAAHRNAALSMAQAVITFLNRALPSTPAKGSVQSLWQNALKLSYATELRPESHGRARELTAANTSYYQRVTELAAPRLIHHLTLAGDGNYQTNIPATVRWLSRQHWRLRTLQGKLLSLARLSKALFTFEGGLDYIAWKLERHSGEAIEIPDRVRRYPLIFVWGMVWRLYRRGVFR
jgi:hypothetical protein